jgi:hypothetical protein
VVGYPVLWVNHSPKARLFHRSTGVFVDGLLILNVDPTIKTSELLCTGQRGWYQNNV